MLQSGILSHAWLFIQALLIVSLMAPEALAATDATSRQALYDEARGHLSAGEAEVAYELLSTREADLAGYEGFDYLLGVAALDSGRPGEAIFCFQRLLASRPEFAGARLDYARAFFEIGDFERARVEFEKVMEEEPPPQVRSTVSSYLAAIDEGEAPTRQAQTRFFFDLSTGYDSNAPAATDDELFRDFRLNPKNVERSSPFSMATVGATWIRPASDDSAFIVSGRLDHRANTSAHFVDSSNLDVGAAWSWTPNNNSITLAGNVIVNALDRSYHRRDIGLTAAWANQLSDQWQVSAFIRGADIRFDDPELSVRDTEQVLGGVGVRSRGRHGEIGLTALAGSDDAKESGSRYSSETEGVRLDYEYAFGRSSAFTAGASHMRVDFDEPFFGNVREDETTMARLGIELAQFPLKNWSSSLDFAYAEKESTVSLYEYDRYEIALSFRRTFE